MAELLIVLWVVCVITFIFSFTAGYAVGAVRQQQRDEEMYQEFLEKHGGFCDDSNNTM